MSWTVGPRLVKPQATWSLWPVMMKGTPGRETPVTWRLPVGVGAWRSAWYQMPGTVWARCLSLERSGLPVAVWVPEMTQLLEPAKQPSQMGLWRVCLGGWGPWGEAVVVWVLSGVCCLVGGRAGAPAGHAHISSSTYGAPRC